MTGVERTPPPQAGPRRVVRGLPASPGVAVGPCIVFDRRCVVVARRTVGPDEVPLEVARLAQAIGRSRASLEELRARLDPEVDAEHRLVLDAQLLMMRDDLLVSSAEAAIRSGKSAEWAVRDVIDGLVARLRSAKESYLRDRAHDLEHVGEQILRALSGVGEELPAIEEPAVLVARDLSVAELLSLPRDRVMGLVTELGTTTGHTAILARALHVPAVVGARGATREVEPGSVVVLDARRGELHVHPTLEERSIAADRVDRSRSLADRLRGAREPRTVLRDGTPLEILANLEVEVEIDEALAERAEGVGLYRTEFLYLDALPDEEQLTEIFVRVGRAFAPRPVTLRTFDLGADKLPRGIVLEGNRRLVEAARAPNPALGLRGLRLALAMRDVFRSQIRAILRAAAHAPLRLMFPMVCTVEDLREARRVVDEARRDLARARLAHASVPIGAMIEVPSAVMLVDAMAEECEFFSLGTNDLAQYALALDRNDPTVAGLATSFSPGLVRLVRWATDAARSRGRPIGICGDMASDPLALPLLVGLGLRSLSMPASEIPLTRAIASRLEEVECRALAESVLACATEGEVRRAVVERFGALLGDLWDEHGLVL